MGVHPAECVAPPATTTLPRPLAPCCSKSILRQGGAPVGVPKLPPRPTTEPQPFHFSTDQRAAEGGAAEAFVFKAQAAAADGRVTRARAKWTGGITCPEPFQLATDVRA